MPRKTILTKAERKKLLRIPQTSEELTKYYTLSEADISLINQHRGDSNRLGFAVQLCLLRYPGFALPTDLRSSEKLISFIGEQLGINTDSWEQYGTRQETRRDHLLELQNLLGLRILSTPDNIRFTKYLTDLSQKVDKGIVLAETLIELLQQEQIIIPNIEVIERICSEAISKGRKETYRLLTESLSEPHKLSLNNLLEFRENTKAIKLVWLQQPAGSPKAKSILDHLERLKFINDLNLPNSIINVVHRNQLIKIAREGAQMTSQHIRDLEPNRRVATITAIILETRATIIDETIDLHDRFMNAIFSKAKRAHSEAFHTSGKAINNKVLLYTKIGKALLQAKQDGTDPYKAIEDVISWDSFSQSVNEAEKLSQPENFDFLYLIGNSYSQLRRYTPIMLDILDINAAPVAEELKKAINVIKEMNNSKSRKVPEDAPISFIRKRWFDLVLKDNTIDPKFYELCVLTELKNSLRAGDIWIKNSRQYKNFEEYLIPAETFMIKAENKELDLAIDTDCNSYLASKTDFLQQQLDLVEKLALENKLPEASITESGRLKIDPLENMVPEEADDLVHKLYGLLPHVKITELLMEVDSWTNFTDLFTHLKSGKTCSDKQLLLTAILSDAINLGLRKMSESCPGTSYSKLSWIQAWHVREETYSSSLAKLVNHQYHQSFAQIWGDGTTSSSDGQNFKMGGKGLYAGQVNLKYGQSPGLQIYTHISDQYAPFHTKVINATVRDATHVLDGLLYHESDLKIQEHYTDTAGFTDHVFALMHMLGYRFAPRIRDLSDKKLYIPGTKNDYSKISKLIGGKINYNLIRSQWNELLRLATSIKEGTVTASLMLRKLGSYPRQNGLAVALRELGRMERTLFTLNWIQDPALRRNAHIGLNKGEAKNTLAKAVFLNRLGEIRDRTYENQRFRANGLNLVVSAIILWNTVYLERAVNYLKNNNITFNEELLQHVSPLGWGHINLTGDYSWKQNKLVQNGGFHRLWSIQK